MRDFPLGDLLMRVIAGAQIKRGEGLHLSCVPTDLIVHSDPRLLERVISNFVINAIRYTDKGLIGMYCEARPTRSAFRSPIPASAFRRMRSTPFFEDHVQLSNPARDRRKGLGLGLSIAKRIADALGHRISVQSELGSGSSFSIELPQSQAAAERLEAEQIAAPAADSERPVCALDRRRPGCRRSDADAACNPINSKPTWRTAATAALAMLFDLGSSGSAVVRLSHARRQTESTSSARCGRCSTRGPGRHHDRRYGPHRMPRRLAQMCRAA